MNPMNEAARRYGAPVLQGLTEEAGKIKQEYLASGGNPEDVISPERYRAAAANPMSLAQRPPEQRKDGSIAAGYVPPDVALDMGLVEKRAVPAVTQSLLDGMHTVSSGVDRDGVGFAIGRMPDGQVVKRKVR